jgi:hypothetical protein
MRLISILLLTVGLLLPRAGAVLAEVAGFQRVTICLGAELVTVTLDQGGNPVETELTEHGPCLAAATPPALSLPVFASRSVQAGSAPALPRAQILPPAPLWFGPPPDRAPPLAA